MDLSLLTHVFQGLRRNELIALAFASNGQLQPRFFTSVEDVRVEGELPEGVHIYYGVCPRKDRSTKKGSVSRALCIWADLDAKDYSGGKPDALLAVQAMVLEPSFLVDTGNGYHAYWLLTQSITVKELEELTKPLAALLGADKAATDTARLLRVPGTTNWKDPKSPKEAFIYAARPDRRYDASDFAAALHVPLSLTARIRTGSTNGFQSRSERDWAVVRGLFRVDMSAEAIRGIFDETPVGDKLRDEPPRGGEKYFNRTLEQALQGAQVPTEFSVQHSCYYVSSKEGQRQVSTFVFHPERLLEGPTEDVLTGCMEAAGFEWSGVSLPRSAFASTSRLIGSLPVASWQWLGTDREARLLLPHLMQQLYEKGLPRAVATYTIGRHEDYFVTHDRVLTADGEVPLESSPYVYVDSGREHPRLELTFPPEEEYRALLQKTFELFPKINLPGVAYPVLSWFMAAPYKAPLAKLGARFPILNVFGTRGAGKTSLLLHVMQPLMGYQKPRSYSVATTPFVLMALLASTNAIPVAFSEFRRGTIGQGAYAKLLRSILLAYDVGRDARGRPDQTTTVYPLDAPFSLDGEDSLQVPAAIERAIIVNLMPETIRGGTEYYEAFQELTQLPLQGFAARYLQFTLGYDIPNSLYEARELVNAVFHRPLPERVKNNLTVCAFGYKSLYDFLDRWGVPLAEPSVENFELWFTEVAHRIVNPQLGRTPVILDEFVTDVVNAVAGWAPTGAGLFAYRVPRDAGEVWFHLGTALPWWLAKRRRENLPALDSAAMKQQLKERSLEHMHGPGQYILGRRTQRCGGNSVSMYGVTLGAATESGLDVPSEVELDRFVISYSPRGKED